MIAISFNATAIVVGTIIEPAAVTDNVRAAVIVSRSADAADAAARVPCSKLFSFVIADALGEEAEQHAKVAAKLSIGHLHHLHICPKAALIESFSPFQHHYWCLHASKVAISPMSLMTPRVAWVTAASYFSFQCRISSVRL